MSMSSYMSQIRTLKTTLCIYENPVPTNLKQVPEFDGYIQTILENKHKALTLTPEKTLKSIQEKVFLAFWPLMKVWLAVDHE